MRENQGSKQIMKIDPQVIQITEFSDMILESSVILEG